MKKIDSADFNKAFGSFIREVRYNAGIPQMQVATHLGVTQSYYSRIESGERNTDFAVAVSICRCLNLDINDFLERYFADNE